MISDKDKYEASALAILQEEIEKLQKKRDQFFKEDNVMAVDILDAQIKTLKRIFKRFVKEIA